MAKADYAGNALVIPGQAENAKKYNLIWAEILDGLSQTILAGQKAYDPQVQTPSSWYWDEPYFLGGSAGTNRRGLGLVRPQPGAEYKQNWGAAHPAGPPFLYCDGSVRLAPYEIDWRQFAVWSRPTTATRRLSLALRAGSRGPDASSSCRAWCG